MLHSDPQSANRGYAYSVFLGMPLLASQLNEVAKLGAEEARQELEAISCAFSSVVCMVCYIPVWSTYMRAHVSAFACRCAGTNGG